MGVNKVILLGNLGADPELRYTNNQNAVCNLRVATGERRKNQDGEWVDHTEWHRVIAWGKTAENCNQYLSKGKQLYVEGRIQTKKWQDKDGNDRYTTEVVAQTVQFVGGRDAGSGLSSNIEAGGSMNQSSPMTQTAPPKGSVSFEDDDIPF